jgi:hypothetical protein
MSILETLVEVTLKQDDDFLKVRETLSRIGVASKKDRKLYQSCHILHKQGRYYIVHFKELFALDGKPSSMAEEDVARRNTIANLVAEWGLVVLVQPPKTAFPVAPVSQIKIIPYREKGEWELVVKYSIGRKL